MPILTENSIRLFSKIPTSTFVETGSCHGDTIANIQHLFNKVYSIELSENLHTHCVNRFSEKSHIHLIQGPSEEKLKEVCTMLDQSTFFWLDAHWSGGFTARGSVDVPLLQELECIMKYCKHECIIAVDDVRLFGSKGNEDWTKITMHAVHDIVKDRINGDIQFTDSHISKNDICFITLKSM